MVVASHMEDRKQLPLILWHLIIKSHSDSPKKYAAFWSVGFLLVCTATYSL